MDSVSKWHDVGHVAGGNVDDPDPDVGEVQVFEVAALRPPVGRERDAGSVGRPGGLEVSVPVVGELPHAARFEVEDVEVADAALHTRKGDVTAVGRPGRVQYGRYALNGHTPLYFSGADVPDGDFVVPFHEGHKSEPIAVRRPGTRRINEAHGIIMRVGVRFVQLVDDSSGLGVGDEEVDVE